jgi:hypothetical protein
LSVPWHHAPHRLQIFDLLTKDSAALVPVHAKGRKFHRTVSRSDAEHESTAGEPVDTRGRLGCMQRMTQWQHDSRRKKRDGLGLTGHIPEPCPGIVDLPQVAKLRIAQRHVAPTERGESRLLGLAGQRDLFAHGWSVTAIHALLDALFVTIQVVVTDVVYAASDRRPEAEFPASRK